MNDQNLGLRVGAACNQAASVLTGAFRLLADGTLTHEQLVEIHRELAEGFFANAQTLQAAQGVADAFPGTTAATPEEAAPFQPQQQAPFTPANQQAPQQQAPFQPQGQNFQPAAQGGGSKEDQQWAALFQDPSAFYDNRQDKANGQTSQGRPVSPNSPDFRAKDGSISLWLNGKYGSAPDWVFTRLQGGQGPVQ